MKKTYNIHELSDMLNISTTAVCELRKKLKIKIVDQTNLRLLQYTVHKIKKDMEHVTTSTICEYFREEAKRYGL